MEKNKYFTEQEFQIASQCKKALYLHHAHPDIATPSKGISDIYSSKVMKKWKDKVKNEFNKRFSDGIQIMETSENYPDIDIASANIRTKEMIKEGVKIIKGALFCNSSFLSTIDVLAQKNNQLDVHLSTALASHVSDTFLLETAYKCYIMEKSGYKFERCFLSHIDNTYVKDGPINSNLLFCSVDFTKEVREKYNLVQSILKASHRVLNLHKIPNVHIGPYCKVPNTCSFYNYCTKHIPDDSIFLIPRLRSTDKWRYYEDGNLHMKDVVYQQNNKAVTHYSSRQNKFIKSMIENKEIIHLGKIKEFCKDILKNANVYLLDVEAHSTPIPFEDGLRPYQQNMLSYTVIKEKQNTLEFFQQINNSSLSVFIKSLIEDFSEPGPILGYNIAFLRGRLRECIKRVPENEIQIEGIINRMVDIMIPFKEGWYISPKMKGSYSYTKVLEAEAFYNSPYKKRFTIEIGEEIADAIFEQKDDEYFKGYLQLSRKDTLDRWKVWTGLKDICCRKEAN